MANRVNPSNFLEVDDNILETISQKYNRTIESLNEDVTILKEWMKSQPHLPEILADIPLQNFLILNKCSMEKAKSNIDMYYTLRAKIPELFKDRHPKNLQDTIAVGYFTVLPKTTKDKYRVVMGKVRDVERVNELDPYNCFKHVLNVGEICMKEDVVFGNVVVFDFKYIGLTVLKKLTPALIIAVVRCYENIFSVPIKGIYILNSHPYMKNVLAMAKMFTKQKLIERIHLYDDDKIILDIFPKEIIPKDYGGEEKSLEELSEILKLKLKEYDEFFDNCENLRVDESLRPQPLENDDVLGFHGHFKKLDID